MTKKPAVMFVCVHNAGRSQMAAAYARHLSNGEVDVRSAGSAPADQLNPDVVVAMREEGIDITSHRPRILTEDDIRVSDVVITMGCGDTCPFFPGKRYEDWKFADPAVSDLDSIRGIRDGIKERVRDLLNELLS
ncbi:MAG: arsenate reductase ArsC [Actinomycetaceae bacterium]|nr:arsenate reductase ArsC [Actinomycetaceae bacterium]